MNNDCLYKSDFLNKNIVAIFAHYSANNKIDDYVIYYLKQLKKIAKDIIFVSDCNVKELELEK